MPSSQGNTTPVSLLSMTTIKELSCIIALLCGIDRCLQFELLKHAINIPSTKMTFFISFIVNAARPKLSGCPPRPNGLAGRKPFNLPQSFNISSKPPSKQNIGLQKPEFLASAIARMFCG